MRTIKFRGKSKLNGKWVYGDLVQCMSDDIKIVNSNRPESVSYKIYDIQSDTIGQFTGLLDKNGMEIYEGDIVKTKGNWGGVVTWNSRGYYYVKDQYYSDDEEPDLSPLGSLHCYERKQLEIISNIHDNPEILKNND